MTEGRPAIKPTP